MQARQQQSQVFDGLNAQKLERDACDVFFSCFRFSSALASIGTCCGACPSCSMFFWCLTRAPMAAAGTSSCSAGPARLGQASETRTRRCSRPHHHPALPRVLASGPRPRPARLQPLTAPHIQQRVTAGPSASTSWQGTAGSELSAGIVMTWVARLTASPSASTSSQGTAISEIAAGTATI